MPDGDFRKLLAEAVEESLSSLGESPKQSILFHLENTFKIKKNEIPDKIDLFDQALRKLFGPGADFLETLIAKKLFEKAELTSKGTPPEEESFAETVASIKRMMAE